MANLCQNPLCHLHNTNDRLKKNNYQTRKVHNNCYHKFFCTLTCLNEFLTIHIDRIISVIGKREEPISRSTDSPNKYDLTRSLCENSNISYYGGQATKLLYRHLISENIIKS